MSGTNLRRLINECISIEKTKVDDSAMYVLDKIADNMYHWKCILIAPNDSLYENYKFELDILLPVDYPRSPMQVKFVTPIMHVNVNNEGDICLDILKTNWSSALNLKSVMISILSLLSEPNPSDPLNSDLAELYRSDVKTYEKKIRNHCAKYAIKNYTNVV